MKDKPYLESYIMCILVSIFCYLYRAGEHRYGLCNSMGDLGRPHPVEQRYVKSNAEKERKTHGENLAYVRSESGLRDSSVRGIISASALDQPRNKTYRGEDQLLSYGLEDQEGEVQR
jgi:hypothetical protein